MGYNTKEIITKGHGTPNIIGQRLYTLRTETNTKVALLAEYLAENHHTDDIDVGGLRSLYYKWENGTKKPNLEMLLNLCNFYNCEIDYILGMIPEKTKPITDIKQQTGLSIQSINKIIVPNSNTPNNKELDIIISSNGYNDLINQMYTLRNNFEVMNSLAKDMVKIKHKANDSDFIPVELENNYDSCMERLGKCEYKMDALIYQCSLSFSIILNDYKKASLKEINSSTSQLL